MTGVLIDTFGWSHTQAGRSLAALMAKALRVDISGTVRVCRDPDDDMLLECSEVAGADLLITGDKDWLVLGSYKETRIVTPAEYLSL